MISRRTSVVTGIALVMLGLVWGNPHALAGRRGSFTKHRYTAADADLSRDYWVYVPSRRAGARVPLVVYLHGCTQDARDAAIGTRWNEHAEKKGFIAVYPDQLVDQTPEGSVVARGNGSGCWNWFRPEHQSRGDGEPSTIAGITRAVKSAYGVDPNRVYLLGASAGADMAVVMGAAYPDLYAAVGAMAGCAYATCADENGALAYKAMGRHARRLPVFVVQGSADPLNNPALSAGLVQQWLGTNDFADNGALDHSVPRTPASVEHHGLDASALEGVGTVGDTCLRPSQFPCAGGAVGFRSYPYSVEHFVDAKGRSLVDFWIIHGLSHDYPGGNPEATFTDPLGPDITSAAFAFFRAHPMHR
jgi:poly(hydroxyalkanoate) depolymerase family esterase